MKHHLFSYARASGRARLAVSCGLSCGVELLQTALAALHKEDYELYRPQLSVTLAESLAKTGERELAYSTICEQIPYREPRPPTQVADASSSMLGCCWAQAF